MISVSTKVSGIEQLEQLIGKLDGMDKKVEDIVAEELWKFADSIHSDQTIPEEYRNSLALTVIPNEDQIVLFADKTDERWQGAGRTKVATSNGDATRFGNKVEWALYVCPKRQYYGGKLALSYTGKDYLKERWEQYKTTFISKVQQRIKSEAFKR